jgi:polysaccharide biosynthesis transport protein
VSLEYPDDRAGAQTPPADLVAIAARVLQRWKLILLIMLGSLIGAYGILKLVPSVYKSTVEILVYDPQQQIDATVQKPISPFVNDIGSEAMNTEINVLKSKSVALRVVAELGLDQDPDFQSHNPLADWVKRLGLPGLGGAHKNAGQVADKAKDTKAERLDQAADALIARMQVWQDSYIIFVSATSRDPAKAQRLAATIAKYYLANQREARREALEGVASWLKGRVDNLQSRVLETAAAIEKLKADSDVRDSELNLKEQQVRQLNTQIMNARADVDEKHARLEQARHVLDTNGDVDSIPDLKAGTTLTTLRQRQTELSLLIDGLQKRLGEHHVQVITAKAQLEAVNKQISDEAEHFLGNMKNLYDIAVRQEQSLEANLQTATAHLNSETYLKLQQLQRVEDADHKLYESYLSQFNDISERGTLQDATARIISPASFPRSASSPRRILFYASGGIAGLGAGFLIAFLLEYLRPGVRTGTEIEESFGRPVLGMIPLVTERRARSISHDRLLRGMVDEPLSHLSEAVHAIRISLELSDAHPKVILITSALPAEGKSTAAMLLAASSASSGKKTLLLDCDLRRQSTSEAFLNTHQPGLSDFLRGTAKIADVMIKDPLTKAYVIPAGSMIPNAADWLMSQRMRDLISVLRHEFGYIIVDTSPLLPVVDALVLATIVDKILVIVEWSETPRTSIFEALKVLRPEARRIAGIVLNKVDLGQLPGYSYRGRYHYRSAAGTSITYETMRPGLSSATIHVGTEYSR